ncbi:uncharacterized protein LOC108595416 isoform X2 [Drosophila busckii]|uniref:uncharacterized protein LOC108595416 isoform X2 n=1 Tax=Drosophila busckii TaxID=30019 RepID=UPI001432E637|nr:uncharacterized protein LOC108595416 isoform X2 [Drosophila busckii]
MEGRSNTGGRLFVRYKNIVSKRRHSMKFSKGSSSKSSSPAATEDNYWLDDNKLYAFKLCLSVENNENEDWHDVCEKWTETFPLRQRELKQRHKEVFLLGWPKLRHEKFMELINIDFEHMHCFKNQLLHSKWPEFKLKICQHYKQIAHKPPFKALFEHAVKSKDMAVQDYMYAILLLFVLPATARFVNETGKTSRRVSVSESQESFVLHVNSIDEHEELMAAMKKKWFAQDLTIQPCLIVEGSTDMDMDINTYYVHFNSRLTKMSSFLDSLDLCFKIFQVLHIPYPKACFEVWLFIQKYFYEIDAEADCKSSNITALIAILDGINISI